MSDQTEASETGEPAPARPAKGASAFRTIGEVADDLDLPAHVLRFWESKFPKLKPLKRAGGRRYYRPEDIVLLRRIRQCLYQDGYTIRGVQKLLDVDAGEREPAPDRGPRRASSRWTSTRSRNRTPAGRWARESRRIGHGHARQIPAPRIRPPGPRSKSSGGS